MDSPEQASTQPDGPEVQEQAVEAWRPPLARLILAEKQRQALYEFDEEELRPYFQLENVVAGMFDIFSRVLGIQVIEEPDVPGWDAAVKYYRVEDNVLEPKPISQPRPRADDSGRTRSPRIFSGRASKCRAARVALRATATAVDQHEQIVRVTFVLLEHDVHHEFGAALSEL